MKRKTEKAEYGPQPSAKTARCGSPAKRGQGAAAKPPGRRPQGYIKTKTTIRCHSARGHPVPPPNGPPALPPRLQPQDLAQRLPWQSESPIFSTSPWKIPPASFVLCSSALFAPFSPPVVFSVHLRAAAVHYRAATGPLQFPILAPIKLQRGGGLLRPPAPAVPICNTFSHHAYRSQGKLRKRSFSLCNFFRWFAAAWVAREKRETGPPSNTSGASRAARQPTQRPPQLPKHRKYKIGKQTAQSV